MIVWSPVLHSYLDDLVLMMMLVTVAMKAMMTMVLNLPSSVRGGDELIHLPASHLPPTLTDEPSLWRRKSDNMPPSPLRNKYWRNYWLQRLRGQFVWSAQCSTHLRNIRPVLSFSYKVTTWRERTDSCLRKCVCGHICTILDLYVHIINILLLVIGGRLFTLKCYIWLIIDMTDHVLCT